MKYISFNPSCLACNGTGWTMRLSNYTWRMLEQRCTCMRLVDELKELRRLAACMREDERFYGDDYTVAMQLNDRHKLLDALS